MQHGPLTLSVAVIEWLALLRIGTLWVSGFGTNRLRLTLFLSRDLSNRIELVSCMQLKFARESLDLWRPILNLENTPRVRS